MVIYGLPTLPTKFQRYSWSFGEKKHGLLSLSDQDHPKPDDSGNYGSVAWPIALALYSPVLHFLSPKFPSALHDGTFDSPASFGNDTVPDAGSRGSVVEYMVSESKGRSIFTYSPTAIAIPADNVSVELEHKPSSSLMRAARQRDNLESVYGELRDIPNPEIEFGDVGASIYHEQAGAYSLYN